MHFGLIASVVLHAALLAWALFTIPRTPELRTPDEQPIEVALITPSELLRLKQGALDVTELEAKAKDAPKPEQSIKEARSPSPSKRQRRRPPSRRHRPRKPSPKNPSPEARSDRRKACGRTAA